MYWRGIQVTLVDLYEVHTRNCDECNENNEDYQQRDPSGLCKDGNSLAQDIVNHLYHYRGDFFSRTRENGELIRVEIPRRCLRTRNMLETTSERFILPSRNPRSIRRVDDAKLEKVRPALVDNEQQPIPQSRRSRETRGRGSLWQSDIQRLRTDSNYEIEDPGDMRRTNRGRKYYGGR